VNMIVSIYICIIAHNYRYGGTYTLYV
jgi:hypothetical protein